MPKDNLLSPALLSAIQTIERMPVRCSDPKQDPRLIALEQIHRMNMESHERARIMEFQANQMCLSTLRAVSETQARIELLKIELGIEPEEEDEHEAGVPA